MSLNVAVLVTYSTPSPPKASHLQNLEALANHLGVVKHSTCTVEVQPMGQRSFLNLIVMESHQDY